MRFTKVIGHSNKTDIKEIIRKAEDKISSVLTEFSLSFTSRTKGTRWGGNILAFQMLYPLPFYCDITALQFDEYEEKLEAIEKKLAAGEPLSEDEKSPDKETQAFRKKMKGKVLRTAATDGKSYYFNPAFVNSLSREGLRIVLEHEALHAIYLHPSRRGSRHPGLYNIAIDIKVNFGIIDDLRTREVREPAKVFTEHLGEFITLEEYGSFLKDPFNPPPRLAHFNPIHGMRGIVDPAYAHPGEDKKAMYFADEKLSDDMKRPENIYDFLYGQIPKCPKCGKIGMYKTPEEYRNLKKKAKQQEEQKAKEKQDKEGKDKGNQDKQKGDKGQDKSDQQGAKDQNGQGNPSDDHNHGDDGQPCEHDCGHNHDQKPGQGQPGQRDPSNQQGQGQSQGGECCDEQGEGCNPGGGCDQCGGDDTEYMDPFGLAGELVDYHMDTDVTEDELGKRLTDAIEMTKRLGGNVPADLDRELGTLISPTIRWEDIVRETMRKRRQGQGKNDWTSPKRKPLFAGLYVPKKRDVFLKLLFAYDCSGSMSDEDISFAISQLQVIDTRGEIFMLSWDTQPYFDKMIKINKADKENLSKAKRNACGGTEVSEVFNQYEEHCGDLDMIIVATDGFLYDMEISKAKIPPRTTSVLWLITSHNPSFKPPFGRVLHMRNEKL